VDAADGTSDTRVAEIVIAHGADGKWRVVQEIVPEEGRFPLGRAWAGPCDQKETSLRSTAGDMRAGRPRTTTGSRGNSVMKNPLDSIAGTIVSGIVLTVVLAWVVKGFLV
jgi:hypothetical protein